MLQFKKAIVLKVVPDGIVDRCWNGAGDLGAATTTAKHCAREMPTLMPFGSK
jgi:hypothetical protein